MLVWFYLPFADLRLVDPNRLGRLRRPNWPAGDTGHRGIGTAEFLRGFGSLKQTPGREADNWSGRRQFIHASMPRLDVNGSGHRLSQTYTIRRRRLYGDSQFPRMFFELLLEVPGTQPTSEQIVSDVASMPVHFRSGETFGLSQVGAEFARTLALATAKNVDDEANVIGRVSPGRPMFVVCEEGSRPSSTGSTAFWGSHTTTFDSFSLNGAAQWGAANALSRIHVDGEALALLAEEVHRRDKHVDEWRWEVLARYYEQARAFRKKPAAYGVKHLQTLLSEYEATRGTDWDFVTRVFGDRAKAELMGASRMTDNSVNIWNRDGTVITGQVVNSFNSINQRDPALANALAEVLEYAKASGNSEAADVAQLLVEQAKEDKKGPARLLWDGLVKFLPEIVTLGTSVGVIVSWLGL